MTESDRELIDELRDAIETGQREVAMLVTAILETRLSSRTAEPEYSKAGPASELWSHWWVAPSCEGSIEQRPEGPPTVWRWRCEHHGLNGQWHADWLGAERGARRHCDERFAIGSDGASLGRAEMAKA